MSRLERTIDHTRTKRRPGRRTPPGDNKPQEPAKPGPSGLGRPEVDGARGRRSGADLGDDGGRHEREDHGDEVARPGEVSCDET